MTALLITGAVLLVLLLLLLAPVRVHVSLREGEVDANLRYLFYTRSFSPEAVAERSEKKAEQDVKKEDKKQTGEADTKFDKLKGAIDTAKLVWSMIKSSRRGLSILRRHLVFSRVQVLVSVGGEDAGKTATLLGQITAVVNVVLDLTGSIFVLKKPRVYLAPDFLRGSTKYDISFRAGIRPVFVIGAAASAGVRILRLLIRDKRSRQIIKGGKQHEPTNAPG